MDTFLRPFGFYIDYRGAGDFSDNGAITKEDFPVWNTFRLISYFPLPYVQGFCAFVDCALSIGTLSQKGSKIEKMARVVGFLFRAFLEASPFFPMFRVLNGSALNSFLIFPDLGYTVYEYFPEIKKNLFQEK